MKTKAYNLVNSVEQDELDAGLLAEYYFVEASDGKNITLPAAFSSDVREDLIRSAVLASRANRRQPYGHREHDGKRAPQPGMKHSVEWWGKGRGVSRIMRKTGQRTGAQNPHTRGGRRAHGPLVAKDWSQKANSKQRRMARDSAIAATADAGAVAARSSSAARDMPTKLGAEGGWIDGGAAVRGLEPTWLRAPGVNGTPLASKTAGTQRPLRSSRYAMGSSNKREERWLGAQIATDDSDG